MQLSSRLAAALVLMVCSVVAWAGEAPTLKIGEAAPALDTGKWLKGAPVEKLEKGKVYVVEFWATWCGPCRQSIPHLSELQKQYPDIVFIGQDCWEQDASAVEPFVVKMGEKMNYRVVMDTPPTGMEGKMAKTWMAAAGENGIPTAFVVNKDAKIAWIGHPMSLEKVLKGVADGTWDMAKAIKDAELRSTIRDGLRGGNMGAALTAIDAAIAADPGMEGEYGLAKLMLLVRQKQASAAATYAEHLASVAPLTDNPETLNEMAWMLVDPDGGLKLTAADLDAAEKIALRGVELSKGEQAPVLDTLARVYARKGDWKKAVEFQTKAVEKATDSRLKAELQKTLTEYGRGASFP